MAIERIRSAPDAETALEHVKEWHPHTELRPGTPEPGFPFVIEVHPSTDAATPEFVYKFRREGV